MLLAHDSLMHAHRIQQGVVCSRPCLELWVDFWALECWSCRMHASCQMSGHQGYATDSSSASCWYVITCMVAAVLKDGPLAAPCDSTGSMASQLMQGRMQLIFPHECGQNQHATGSEGQGAPRHTR